MPAIDRDAPIPIYHQLRDLIRAQIEGGTWGPGEPIPTEKDLCQRYGISRGPVRQALGELVNEGLLVRRAGLGTFVATIPGSGYVYTDELLEIRRADRLESVCPPEVRSYLRSGMRVLHARCGAGPLTLDTALRVRPGSVVGIDVQEKAISHARALAKELKVNNVAFQVANPYHLEFPDETFDLTFSIWLVEFLGHPVRALKEQKRVTRRGGRVVAVVGDTGARAMYPPCPAFDQWWEAQSLLNDPADERVFFNPHVARRTPELFSQVGFDQIEVGAYALWRYAGSESFDAFYQLYRYGLELDSVLAHSHQKLIELGALDQDTLVTAQRELDAWHAHPHAFWSHVAVLVAGKV